MSTCLDCSHRRFIIIGSWPWSWLGVLTPGGTPLYKPYRYVPPPKGMEPVLGLFGLKTGTDFAHFGLKYGRVSEATSGAYERIYRFSSK